ncbi:hypothetical protein ACI79G_00830 [Geodermatophilus sp. SYSU D00779]
MTARIFLRVDNRCRLGRFQSGRDLAKALMDGQIPASFTAQGPTGSVTEVLDIAEVHSVPEAHIFAFDLAKQLDAAKSTRGDIRKLPRCRPQVADAIGWAPTRPPAVRRGW